MSFSNRLSGVLPASLRPFARRGYRLARHGWLRMLVALRLQRRAYGRSPELVRPKLYSDKIVWRMLYDRRPLLETCADRLAVRDYVAARAGEQYLVPLLGVYERPEDIRWEELELPYVVKATHGCGWNIMVCKPGDTDPEGFRATLGEWLGTNYYYVNWEWPYKHVPPRIIVERFLGREGKVPSDFKFFCFGGEPRAVWECHDRSTAEEHSAWHDPSWNLLSFVSPQDSPGPPEPPPSRLGEMLDVARALSRDFDFVRVDLYCVQDQVYFGELTTTPAAGGWPYSDEGEAWLGGFWRLPSRRELRRARRTQRAAGRV